MNDYGLMHELEVEVRRLTRRAAVMNVGLSKGLPLLLIEEIIKPVATQTVLVIDLLSRARTLGFGDLTVLVADPVSDSLTRLFTDDVAIPDDISSLFGEDDDH